jgi:DNA-binding IclR family transcriptional regulator
MGWNLSLYQQALERIRDDFLEMPGMRLTFAQVARLSGLEEAICRRVLDDLVREQFLCVRPDQRYARRSDDRAS